MFPFKIVKDQLPFHNFHQKVGIMECPEYAQTSPLRHLQITIITISQFPVMFICKVAECTAMSYYKYLIDILDF